MTEAELAEAELQAAYKHAYELEKQNIALLRWQSVASEAHIDHLCDIIRSLAASDEVPRSLRELSAMGVVDEIHRAFKAERINREKSEASAREWRKKAEDAEAEVLTERAAVVAWLRKHWFEVLEQTPQQTAKLIEHGEHRREEET